MTIKLTYQDIFVTNVVLSAPYDMCKCFPQLKSMPPEFSGATILDL